MTLRQFLVLALMGALLGGLAAIGYKAYRQYAPQDEQTRNAGALAYLPNFSLPDIEGHIWRAEEWKNKILVVNFWATWCPPCRKEMPMFLELQQKYSSKGVQFVGIAIDDPQAVRDFVDTYGIEFPILIGDTRGIELSNRLGNRFSALPYTLVADRSNKIVFRQMGQIKQSVLEPLLQQLSTGH